MVTMVKKRTILIVEDESVVVECLSRMLEYHGFFIVGNCDKGSDAISKAKALKPDIILMDIMLKDGVSGCDAALEIRKCIATKIIYLTGYSSSDIINHVASSDADGYILKPYLEQQVLATIALALATGSKEVADQQSNHSCHVHTIPLNNGYLFDRKRIRLFKENHEVILSSKALKLVTILSENVNVSISFEQLSHYIYGKQMPKNTLRSLVFRTRKVLGENLIVNSSGLGYKIVSAPLQKNYHI